MKFITLTLALLGVVGALRFNQVPVPAMNSLSLIFAQKDNCVIEHEIFDDIEASPNKSMTKDKFQEGIIAFAKKYHVKISPVYLKWKSD